MNSSSRSNRLCERNSTASARKTSRASRRSGKVLALFALALPVLLAVSGLLLDGSGLLNQYRIAQNAADAAACAAAESLQDGATTAEATTIAEQYVQEFNGLTGATVAVSIPPISGPYTGDAKAVEVEVRQPSPAHFLSFLGGGESPYARTRAVARIEPSTAGAALVVLDPDPPPLALTASLGLLPPLPSLFGAFESLDVGRLRVDGAIHINTAWGGVDENGDPAGESSPPPCALACPTALLSEKVQARDIRVVGGVDDLDNYGPFVASDPHPVQANRRPVPDPLADVPAPTLAADPANVSGTVHGGLRVVDIPLLSPPRTLQPGVYDFIQIVSGTVTFSPGVYVIRGVDPLTNISLSILGGTVTADGVLFYITTTAGYAPASGVVDDADGETVPSPMAVATVIPSTVINVLLPTCQFRGLDDPSSPFNGILIYQRRLDRRPVVVLNGLLGLGQDIEGIIYAKWGHVILAGSRFQETRVVAGTLRLLSVLPSVIAPTELLPPAEDVFLVE